MTLILSASTIAAAEQNLPALLPELWQDSLQTFPLAHAALARAAEQAKADGAKAIVSPADLIDLTGYSLERYSLEIKSFRFSDALWRLAAEIHGVTFATRLCHQVAAFTPTSAGMSAYAKFTSPANQALCQVAGLTDC
ncbi:MAG: hypothetical protein HC895_05960 [Leptolyngbyaceae cyanobacterium SM1_3_5]|nr:hypothetical protein [Leptolyngbyaceae cyanobacterium SM1_3_5]